MDKIDNTIEIVNLIVNQRQYYYKILESLYIWDDGKIENQKDCWNYIFNGNMGLFLNAYEYACVMYLNDRVDKKIFKEMFKCEIISLYKDDIGKDCDLSIFSNSDYFCSIRKVAEIFINDK